MIDDFIAAFIIAISPLALLQFFVSYCHSIIAKSRSCGLSDQARELSGVSPRTVRGEQFQRLLQLIALCPEPGGDTHQLQAVSVYFGMLGFLRVLLSWAFPAAEKWIEAERGGCAYAAAVVLDRRIMHSRTLIARQAVPLR